MPVATTTALAIGAAAAGTGASIYGAKKQSSAIKDANNANRQAVADTNAANYRLWLESRGIGDGGKAVNTKLPRWMNVTMGGGGPRRAVRKNAFTAPQQPASMLRGSMPSAPIQPV